MGSIAPIPPPVPVAAAVLAAPDGRFVHANRVWPDLLASVQRASAAILGQAWDVWWFGDPEDRLAFAHVLRTGDARVLRPLVIDRAGRRSVWDCMLVPLPAADGVVETVLLTCTDVTDAALASERLAERVRAQEHLLAHSGHELRGPLAPLAAYSEVLRRMLAQPLRDSAWDEQAARVLASFDRQVRVLTMRLDDLLELARLEGGAAFHRQSQDVGALIGTLAGAIRQGPGHPAVQVEREPSVGGRVIADTGWLARALQALAGEVWSRSPAGTEVRLRVGTAGAAPRVARFELSAADAPARIAPPDLVRARERGRGPGMAWRLARHVADQHEGRVGSDADEAVPRFWIEIPLHES